MVEELQWFERSSCLDMDTNIFFDEYELNSHQAKQTDEICMSCPVRQLCLIEAVKNDSTGVFGGVYLSLGNYSKQKNKHKTKKMAALLVEEIRSIREYLRSKTNSLSSSKI